MWVGVYIKPYCRASPWIIGIVLGYIFFKYKKVKLDFVWINLIKCNVISRENFYFPIKRWQLHLAGLYQLSYSPQSYSADIQIMLKVDSLIIINNQTHKNTKKYNLRCTTNGGMGICYFLLVDKIMLGARCCMGYIRVSSRLRRYCQYDIGTQDLFAYHSNDLRCLFDSSIYDDYLLLLARELVPRHHAHFGKF